MHYEFVRTMVLTLYMYWDVVHSLHEQKFETISTVHITPVRPFVQVGSNVASVELNVDATLDAWKLQRLLVMNSPP